MTGPVRKRRQRPVFTYDQCQTLHWALGTQYEQLFPILEKATAGYKARRALPSLDDEIRAHARVAKDLATLCRRFLQGLEKVTPSWRTVQQWEFGPPPVPAELDERMAASNKSRCAVEDLMKQVQGWEEIGSRLRSRKPGKQTERRSLLAKYVGLQMMAVGIKLTKFAKVKTPPGGHATTLGGAFTTTLQVVYEASDETVVDLYPDVARAIKALEGFEGLLGVN